MATKLAPEMKKALKVRSKKEKELEKELLKLREFGASLMAKVYQDGLRNRV